MKNQHTYLLVALIFCIPVGTLFAAAESDHEFFLSPVVSEEQTITPQNISTSLDLTKLNEKEEEEKEELAHLTATSMARSLKKYTSKASDVDLPVIKKGENIFDALDDTKMVKFFCNKLARDRFFEGALVAKAFPDYYYLEGEALLSALKNKLIEEATEVISAKNKKQMISELADLLEVIDGLCKAYAIDKTEIFAEKEKLYKERGGFEHGCFVNYIKMSENDPHIAYFRANSDRYPEEACLEE